MDAPKGSFPSVEYEEPFYWWGPGWNAPQPRSLQSLLSDDTIDIWTAAHLWAALARGRSLAVVAGPSGTGKTSLLTALLELIPTGTSQIYIRGCFESFAFLTESNVDPPRSALLVNELSPHLPVYLWGPGVARLLAIARGGFTVLATAHATSGLDFVGLLAASPLRIPPQLIAVFEFVVAIAPDQESASGRRVTGLWRLQATRAGVTVESLTPADASDLEFPAPWFPRAEISSRAQLLATYRDALLATLPVVVLDPAEPGVAPARFAS